MGGKGNSKQVCRQSEEAYTKLFIFMAMPQDTTYIIMPSGDTVLFSSRDSVQQAELQEAVRKIMYELRLQEQEEHRQDQVMVALYVTLGIVVVVLIPLIVNFIRNKIRYKRIHSIYESKQLVYNNILLHYLPYYNKLSSVQKERFLKRTLVFMSSKQFRFIELEKEDLMPLLISATAVQVTFGLKYYKMDHFRVIYVMRNTYRYGLFNVPFEGHVSDNGIYLSWHNFLKAYSDYSDGDNVGLHEMAHALSYVNFTANRGADEAFKERFRVFSKTGREVFRRIQSGETLFLGSYAATNYEEFWAVCVENFFERPQTFIDRLPELYRAMCKLLNQDMLTSNILVEPVENV